MAEQTEETFLAEYDPKRFPPSAITADVAAFSIRDGVLCVLAIERANYPFLGRWALPGTFPDAREDTYDAAVRALALRTGITPSYIEQLATYTDPDRDPRMRIASVAYLAFGPFRGDPQAGYHATKADWLRVNDDHDWAFDHGTIVTEAVRRVQSKMEYTTLATRFLGPTFTMPELMDVYRIVWGKPMDVANFYRKVKATKGFVERIGGKGRVSTYQAGPAKMLYPPIRREDWP